jgi:hypothetical protein
VVVVAVCVCVCGWEMPVYFGGAGCGLNNFFISLNLIMALVVSVLAISPRVQSVRPTSGLLQASIVTVYALYVVGSALTDEVNVPGVFECNRIADSSTQTVRPRACAIRDWSSGTSDSDPPTRRWRCRRRWWSGPC